MMHFQNAYPVLVLRNFFVQETLFRKMMALYRKFSFCDPICFFLSLNNPSQVQYTSIREFSASSILLNLEIWRKVMIREIFQL